MYLVAATAIVLTMLLSLCRAVTGPTVFDRILAANVFATKTVVLIALVGFLTGRPDFLDLALLYALLNFVGVVAVLKFVRAGVRDESEIGMEVESSTT